MRLHHVLFFAIVSSGCTPVAPGAPVDSACIERFWIRPPGPQSRVELVGSWNGFARPGVSLQARSDGWFMGERKLGAGPVRYAFIRDGVWVRDLTAPLEETFEGRPVSRRDVADCTLPQLALTGVRIEASALRFTAVLSPSSDGTPFTRLALRDEETGNVSEIPVPHGVQGEFAVTLAEPSAKRFAFRVEATDALGRRVDRRSFVWTDGLTDSDRVGYQILPDRFRGEGGAALAMPASLAARAGGRLSGVVAELRRGTFEALGVNTLWLMPIVQNTRSSFDIGEGAEGTGYHGYWAASADAIDESLGTDDNLRELLSEAHRRGIRVILDVVPNHVHDEHPFWRAHAGDGWFNGTPGSCTCGDARCPWDTAQERCWFAPYLPDVNWDNHDAAEAMTAATARWLERFSFDGVRIDAVPMMPRGATRAIIQRLRDTSAAGSPDLLALGEIFTGPDAYDALRYHLGPFGLSSTFHFPLFWALRGAFLSESAPLSWVTEAVARGEASWGSSGAVMATFLGNHDVARSASVASGSSAGRFVTEDFSTDPATWAKLRLGFTALYTLPGFPFLYQGDELGLPGTGDPVTRRPLPARDSLPVEATLLERHLQQLGQLRRCSAPLRRGSFDVLHATSEALVLGRRVGEDFALAVLARAPTSDIRLTMAAPYNRASRGFFQGGITSLRDELTIPKGAVRTFEIWLPSDSPCLDK